MPDSTAFTQYSTIGKMSGKKEPWWPDSEAERLAAYEKYDQLYWNDPTQYAIRVLDNEEPIYIPNSRTIVDTMSYYLLKGLKVSVRKGPKKDDAGAEPPKPGEEPKLSGDAEFLEAFLKRERFYSRFHNAKHTGIRRGDWAMHVTADPLKKEGSRITLEPLHPGLVWKIEDPDDPGSILATIIFQDVTQVVDEDSGEEKIRVRVLTYYKMVPEGEGGTQTIERDEVLYELEPEWYARDGEINKDAVVVEVLLPREALDPRIDQIPVYWFKNIDDEDGLYGSSELRGLEFLDWAVSQGSTDVQAALALEGLGVYATDGGRPVDDNGNEKDWEVYPGGVMEVPGGSYFRRVDGVGSITPMLDQIHYLEQKMAEATASTDVARGQVDVTTAESGIALAIKFMPTLAKLADRDTAGVETLEQMFFDLRQWFLVYEGYTFTQDIVVTIDKDKLPANRVDILNELNNMLDRKIISKKYYRERMRQLGHDIPEDEDDQIILELQAMQAVVNLATNQEEDNGDGSAGSGPSTSANGGNTDNIDKTGNKSNNQSRPNESGGTEAK